MSRLTCVGLLLLGLLSLRLVHLGADTPVSITLPDDAGLYVDEGYKTMGPRNRVLFGSDTCSPADSYHSWRNASRLTQSSYYAAFRALTPDLESARLVSIVYFGLFLAGYVWAMGPRLRWPVFIGGLLALGLESTLFFYSRNACFEVPMMACIYGLLFCFARMDERRVVLPLLLTAVCGAFVARTIKMSAVFYMVPIGVAVVIHLLLQTRSGPYRRLVATVVAGVAVVALISFAVGYDWIHEEFIQQNINQSSHPYSTAAALYRALTMPLIGASPFVVIGGLLGLAHGLATRPDHYLGSVYRLTLICIVLLVPVIVAVFPYNPLRYYMPALPAYLLLALEWIQTQSSNADVPGHVPLLRRIGVMALLAVAMFAAMFAAYRLFSLALPPRWASRSDVVKYFFLPAAVALGALLWSLRGTIFRRRVLAIGQLSLVLGFAFYSAYGLLTFLTAPTYQLRAVSLAVARIVGPEGTLAGDWAPIVVLGTPIRAYYMNSRFNPVKKIHAMRPDYFLYGESQESQRSLADLRRAPGVRVGAPIDVGTYYDPRWRVALYPLSYDFPNAP